MKPRTIKQWLAEIDLAQKREKDWRTECDELWKQYEQEQKHRQKYAVLWSNTDVMRASLYNSLPAPDVRRRFRDTDPIGKEVSEVLQRALTFGIDDPDFETATIASVLDVSLPGRGVMRVRYVPTFSPDGQTLEFEAAPLDHVQWDDFLRGCGKTWKEITWVGFKHRMTREEIADLAGKEMAARVKVDDLEDTEFAKGDTELRESYKTCLVYELWDKDTRKVLFVTDSVKDVPLKEVDDPLGLSEFFPCPEPLRIIENSRSLTPIPHYRTYQTQAEQLMRIVARINKLVDDCRARGICDPRITELDELFRTSDSGWVPIANQSLIAEVGGLDKAIWMMPVDKIIQVLNGLYNAFNAQRQQIFEVTGFADIMRGQTDPNETLGAQQLKSKWGSLRIQRVQRAVQKFIRDCLRLQAQIIGNKFQPATLEAMTGMKISPEALQVLKSPMMRQFRVDIETDSTIAEQTQGELKDMADVLSGLQQWYQGAIPAVQMQLISPDAVKSVGLAVVRRARMGTVVEDAIEGQGGEQAGAPQIGPDGQPLPVQPGMPVPQGQPMPAQAGQPMPEQQGLEGIARDAIAKQDQASMMWQQAGQSMQAVQQALQAVQHALQQFEADRQILPQIENALSGVIASLTDAVQQMNAPRRAVLQTDAAGRPVGAVMVPVPVENEAAQGDVISLLGQLSQQVAALAAPREISIERDASGRPVGGTSITLQ